MARCSNAGTPAHAERVALITGASRGLGYTVAEFLARQRWTLILTARHEVPLLEAVKDRKSTRLNSSHANISYAVFCLKKKNTKSSCTICDIQPPQLRCLPACIPW